MALPPEPQSPGADAYLLRARSLIERAIRRRWDEGLITKDADGVFTAFLVCRFALFTWDQPGLSRVQIGT